MTYLEIEKGLRNKGIREGYNRWCNTGQASLQSQVVVSANTEVLK